MLGIFGQRKSQTRPERESGTPPGTHPPGLHPAALCPVGIVLVLGSSRGKAANPKSRRHQERPLERPSGSQSSPCALAHPGLGSSPLPLQVSSQCRNFGNNLTTPRENRTSSSTKAATEGQTAARKCCSISKMQKIKIPLLLLSHWSFTNPFCPSKIPWFIPSPIFFCPWWREKEVFQGSHSSSSLRHDLVVQPLQALPSLCGTWTNPKRQILKAIPTGKS